MVHSNCIAINITYDTARSHRLSVFNFMLFARRTFLQSIYQSVFVMLRVHDCFAVWFCGLWHSVTLRWIPEFRREYDTYLFIIEVVLKMDVACSSEMLVSDDKDITLSPQHRTSNVYSELTLVNKLINLSCEFSYVKIGKIYK